MRGLEASGRFTLLACLEVEPVFCESIRLNRHTGRFGAPSMPVFEEDIREFPPDRMMKELDLQKRELDLLIGGPPCQSFSTAGRRVLTRLGANLAEIKKELACFVEGPKKRRRRRKWDENEVCSYCGKRRLDAVRLVAGPGVWICEECVRLCREILVEQQHQK